MLSFAGKSKLFVFQCILTMVVMRGEKYKRWLLIISELNIYSLQMLHVQSWADKKVLSCVSSLSQLVQMQTAKNQNGFINRCLFKLV